MSIRKVKSSDKVETNKGMIARERGPIVYCFEEVDNPDIENVKLSTNTKMSTEFKPDFLNGVEIITAGTEGSWFTAIPYYVWNNRGKNKMKVRLPEE